MLANKSRRMRAETFVALMLIGALWAGVELQASPTVEVEAILVQASNQPGPVDRRLSGVEGQLRQVFQFQRYEVLGIRRQSMQLTQQIRLDLGHGYAVNVHTGPGNGRIRAQIEWFHGGRRLLSTSVNLVRGVPTILGGPPHGGGTLILVLQFR